MFLAIVAIHVGQVFYYASYTQPTVLSDQVGANGIVKHPMVGGVVCSRTLVAQSTEENSVANNNNR
jgi:hypothetical protein